MCVSGSLSDVDEVSDVSLSMGTLFGVDLMTSVTNTKGEGGKGVISPVRQGFEFLSVEGRGLSTFLTTEIFFPPFDQRL